MTISKKAQIGKGIVFLPVLLFIIMILAIYLFVATGALIKKPSVINPESISLTDNDLLLKKISIPINGKEKEMLVLDAYILFDNGKIKKEEMKEFLKQVIANDKCILLSTATKTLAGELVFNDAFNIQKRNNEISDQYYSDIFKSYRQINVLNYIPLGNDDKIFIEYYYGECLR